MLLLSELTHLFFSAIAAIVVWVVSNKKIKFKQALLLAVMAGFFIDLDHLFDYYLVYGTSFSLNDFITGKHFLLSDKMHIPFHGWEHVVILAIVILIIKSEKVKIMLGVIMLSLFFHLGVDLITNKGLTFKSYSLISRIKNNFKIERLVTKEHYLKHREERESYIFGPESN